MLPRLSNGISTKSTDSVNESVANLSISNTLQVRNFFIVVYYEFKG
jgi:hypothetical protein